MIGMFLATAAQAGAQVTHTLFQPALHFSNNGDQCLLDLNQDGINDFSIHLSKGAEESSGSGMISIEVLGEHQILSTPHPTEDDLFFPVVLQEFDQVGWSSSFSKQQHQALITVSNATAHLPVAESGHWKGISSGYLGVMLNVDGDYFYGWIELVVDAQHELSFELKGMGVASKPNSAILAGDLGKTVGVPVVEPEEWGVFFEYGRIVVDATKNQLEGTQYYICSTEGKKLKAGDITPYMIIPTQEWGQGYYFMFLHNEEIGGVVIKFFVGSN